MPARFFFCLALSMLCCGCSDDSGKMKPKPVRTALVTLVTAATDDIPFMIEAVGTVTPSASVNIVSRTDGELQQTLVHDGERVQKGQLLFIIEKKPYEIALLQAQARVESDRAKLTKARDDYARAQKMSKGGFSSAAETDASRVELISAQAALREDEAALEKAKLDLSYCEVRSPINGRAGDVLVDTGNVLKTQTQLLVVDAVQPADIIFSVPERHLPLIRRNLLGDGLKVSAVTKEGSSISGDVTFIGNVDADTGTIPLKALFDNQEMKLWPGEFLRVNLQLDTRRNAVTVPSRAVLLGPDGSFVYVVGDDMTARIRLVNTDVEHEGTTVIVKGLNAGEKVVLEGHVRLKDGMPVRLPEKTAGVSMGEQR